MRKTFFLAAIVAVSILAASCSKESKEVQTFKASAEQAAENGKIALSGLQLRWSAGDQISVYDNASNSGVYALASGAGTNSGTFGFSSGSSVSAAPYSAVYPASIRTGATTVSLPAVQHTANGGLQELPMYAVGDDMELKFHHLCGVVRFRLSASSVVSVSRIAVATDRNTNGAATVSGSGSSVMLSTPSGSNVTTLACEVGQSISSAHDFYMYLPAGTYSTFRILLTAADGSICSKSANTGITVERGKITTITLNGLTFTAHRFTVDNNNTVVFSPGNLQYQASTNTWRFAERHWDFIGSHSRYDGSIDGTVYGSDGTLMSSSYNGWIDLFGWGTSGWNSGANCYQPWSTSTNNADYYPGGAYTNSLTGTYAHADWGVHNAIFNGGNVAGQWRTFTYEDWSAVLLSRSVTTRYAKIQIADTINGLVLFPDDYVHPDGVAALNSVNSEDVAFTTNVYSFFDWFKMEAAGAVLLPAAGDRFNRAIWNVGLAGNYWSSSYYDANNACRVYFTGDLLHIELTSHRRLGFSVRLVRD